jgi:hypothetical protein
MLDVKTPKLVQIEENLVKFCHCGAALNRSGPLCETCIEKAVAVAVERERCAKLAEEGGAYRVADKIRNLVEIHPF